MATVEECRKALQDIVARLADDPTRADRSRTRPLGGLPYP